MKAFYEKRVVLRAGGEWVSDMAPTATLLAESINRLPHRLAQCGGLNSNGLGVRFPYVLPAVLLGLFLLPLAPSQPVASVELYGTFNAIGVTVNISLVDDPDRDGTAMVEYRVSGTGQPYRLGFDLSRIGDARFVGSIFWLEPGTAYDVRVTLRDPDGGPIDGLSVQATGSTRPEIVMPMPNKSFYVSSTGSGTACSLVLPCALATALSQAQPGDEVVLRGGIYYQGEIEPPRSGTPGAPIVIRGFVGEMPVLDGADPATFQWTGHGGGIYVTTVNAADPNLVLADGQRLYPYQSLADLQSLKWGIPGFYASDTALYVRLAADANPNTRMMTVSRYSRAFDISQDFIYLEDLTFRHYGRGDSAKAISLENASDTLVQGCTFAINDTGIVIKGASHRNVIQDSEFYDTTFTWPWEAGKRSGLETGGVRFGSETTGRGNVVRRNRFHDYFDGLHICPDEVADDTSEFDVYENAVYRAGDDGMETDGWCSNIRIWNNTIHDVLSGISLAPVRDGPVYAIRNLIYRIGAGTNDFSGSPFKFNSNGGRSGPMYLVHNTVDAVHAGNDGLQIKEPGVWELVYSRNNIWMGSVQAVNNENAGQPADLDYDDLWNGNRESLVRWDDANYADLTSFVTEVGQERHGVSVEPGFCDSERGDYALRFDSDLVDAGVVIPGINDGYAGLAPDIGAFEYTGYGFAMTATPSFRAVPRAGVVTYTVGIRPVGGFTGTVDLAASSTCTGLTHDLVPTAIIPPGSITLTLLPHPGPRCAISIVGSAGDIKETIRVGLLVGGSSMPLPVVVQRHGDGVWTGSDPSASRGGWTKLAIVSVSAIAAAAVATWMTLTGRIGHCLTAAKRWFHGSRIERIG